MYALIINGTIAQELASPGPFTHPTTSTQYPDLSSWTAAERAVIGLVPIVMLTSPVPQDKIISGYLDTITATQVVRAQVLAPKPLQQAKDEANAVIQDAYSLALPQQLDVVALTTTYVAQRFLDGSATSAESAAVVAAASAMSMTASALATSIVANNALTASKTVKVAFAKTAGLAAVAASIDVTDAIVAANSAVAAINAAAM